MLRPLIGNTIKWESLPPSLPCIPPWDRTEQIAPKSLSQGFSLKPHEIALGDQAAREHRAFPFNSVSNS